MFEFEAYSGYLFSVRCIAGTISHSVDFISLDCLLNLQKKIYFSEGQLASSWATGVLLRKFFPVSISCKVVLKVSSMLNPLELIYAQGNRTQSYILLCV